MYLIQWTRFLIDDLILKTRRNRSDSLKMCDATSHVQLDYRFRSVSIFLRLKIFRNFSQVKQWIGVEQKAIVRQWISIIASLLVRRASNALHCARVVIDFVLLTQYRIHDEDTLAYMNHVLLRLNILKKIFRALRSTDFDINEGHFNFFKFHAITHYIRFIRNYGVVDEFDISHSEVAHKYLVKAFYKRINKRVDFYEQLLWHNTRRLNLIVMNDVLAKRKVDDAAIIDERLEDKITFVIRSQNLEKMRWILTSVEKIELSRAGLNHRHWRRASHVARHIQISSFIEALFTYVQECRARHDERQGHSSVVRQTQDELNNMKQFFVSIHFFLKCWKRDGKDVSDTKRLMSELVRCSLTWQGDVKERRQDHVWVQKFFVVECESHAQYEALRGKLSSRLLLIISVIDEMKFIVSSSRKRYIDALVDVYRSLNDDRPHDIHEMVEIEQRDSTHAFTRRNARRARRFYELSIVLRNAHLISIDSNTFYVNNYVNWNQYNIIYDEKFLVKSVRVAEVYRKRKLRWLRMRSSLLKRSSISEWHDRWTWKQIVFSQWQISEANLNHRAAWETSAVAID